MRPVVLTIAGSDPSAGAGVQADLKAIEANRAYAATAVTAITVQNTLGVERVVPLGADLVREQILAVLEDLDVRAVKSGMLGNPAIVRGVAGVLRDRGVENYVCDPVRFSSSGAPLLEEQAVETLRAELIPLAAVVTPNAHEAEALTGVPVRGSADAEQAARLLLGRGARAVLVTGGHFGDRPGADLLVTGTTTEWFETSWIDTPDTHGTGCMLSSAVAAGLAHGLELGPAIRAAKCFVTEALRHGLRIGRGRGVANAFHGRSAISPPAEVL